MTTRHQSSFLAYFSIFFVAGLPLCASVHAQISEHDRSRLLGQIEQDKSLISPDRFPNLETAKREVRGKLDAVDRFLNNQRSKSNADAWRDYLDLKPLSDALAGDSIANLAQQTLDARYRLIGIDAGLESITFTDLRQSLERLISAIRFRDGEKSKEQLAQQLTLLAERIEKMQGIPSAEDAAAIASLIGLLDESSQAEGVVSTIREVFGRPNVSIFVAEQEVQRAINRSVDQSRAVHDCILGTRIVGQAHTSGFITADLLPSIGSARIQVALTGNVTTQNIGYNGPVKLHTVGHGDVTASRTLHVNESGVMMEPTLATAALRTEITSIDHKLRIVRRIAKKKAAEQKPMADQIAVAKMQYQVGQEFDEQTNRATGIAPLNVSSLITPYLQRLSLADPPRLWGSTADAIFIDSTLRRNDQISTAVTRPAINASFEAAVQIQESVVDNVLGPYLAGRTVNEGEINDLLAQSGRDVASDKKEDNNKENEPSFEIDFARVQPVVFEARDSNVRLGVRGTRFAQGERELKVPMEITARYRPAYTPEGHAILIRDKDVEVHFPGRTRLSISQAGLKRTIQQRFNEVFPDSLLHRAIEVPQTVKLDSLRGRSYRANHIDSRDGWLTISVH